MHYAYMNSAQVVGIISAGMLALIVAALFVAVWLGARHGNAPGSWMEGLAVITPTTAPAPAYAYRGRHESPDRAAPTYLAARHVRAVHARAELGLFA